MRGAEKLGGQPVIPKSRAADINLEKQHGRHAPHFEHGRHAPDDYHGTQEAPDLCVTLRLLGGMQCSGLHGFLVVLFVWTARELCVQPLSW
jgi:hypothetical protein